MPPVPKKGPPSEKPTDKAVSKVTERLPGGKDGLAGTVASGAAKGASGQGAVGKLAGGGATGAVAGAAVALLKSKKHRRKLLAIAALGMLPGMFPLLLVVGLSGTAAVLTSSYQTQINGQAVTASAVSEADYALYTTAQEDTGVPWEVLAAVRYYESGPGVGLGEAAGSCLPGRTIWNELYCPNVSSSQTAAASPAASSKGVGPMGLTPAAGVSKTIAESLPGSVSVVAHDLYRTLENEPGWQDNTSFGAGIISGAQGTTINRSDQGAQLVETDYPRALAALPIAGNTRTLDANIFGLATDWYLGQSPVDGGGPSTGVVCGVSSSKALQVVGPGGSAVTLDATQLSNAAITVHVAKSLGISKTGMVIAVGTELTESTMYNLPNANVPGSETNPNVQWGSYFPSSPPSNGTSIDPFQQQNNWGSVGERMNLSFSAAAFFGRPPGFPNHPSGLLQIPRWQQIAANGAYGEGIVAQEVQGSAFGGRYQAWMGAADTVVGAVLHIACTGSAGTVSVAGDSPQAKKVIEAAAKWINKAPYVWGGGTAAGPSGSAVGPSGYIGKPGFDCSGLVLYAFAQVGITLPHASGVGGQYTIVKQAGGFTTNIVKLKPGDLVFFAGSDGTMTNPGHVGIYIGHDKMIDAEQTGTLVAVDPVSSFGGFVGGGPV